MLVSVFVFVVLLSTALFAGPEVDDVERVTEEELVRVLPVVMVGFPGLFPFSLPFVLVSVFVLDCPSGSDREPIVLVVIVS